MSNPWVCVVCGYSARTDDLLKDAAEKGMKRASKGKFRGVWCKDCRTKHPNGHADLQIEPVGDKEVNPDE